jgi:Mlc titration factor MtfA (ptsG expression regulator)/Flp pilus assembly protein TadD
MVFEFFRNRRRRQLLSKPLDESWQGIIARNVAVYRWLPPAQQQKLVAAARIIAAERRFVGCRGLEVTEEMKVTIAAQAALLLLGEEGYYFDRITSILLYPFQMVLPAHGVRPSSEEDDFDERVILGQAFQQGEIILSWPDVLRGGRVADDGENVVLHELAHHLDGLDGQMGGSPPGLAPDRQDHFQQVFEEALARLRGDLASGRPTVLLPAAAESVTELFAYGTECFFERPAALREWHSEFFGCLCEFYKLDPSEWLTGRAPASHTNVSDERGLDLQTEETPAAEQPSLQTADQYFTRGHEHLEAGRIALAEADFDRAVKLDPRDQEALVYRAEARLSLGNLESALADAERACALDSDDVEARRVRGMTRVALEDYAGGCADLQTALAPKSDDVDGHFYRGLARAQTGQFQAAIRDLTRVIELDPDDAEAHYERGHCWQQLGNASAAETDFARARALGIDEHAV